MQIYAGVLLYEFVSYQYLTINAEKSRNLMNWSLSGKHLWPQADGNMKV